METIKEIDFGFEMNGERIANEIIDEILRDEYKKYGMRYQLAFYHSQFGKGCTINITKDEVWIKYNIRSNCFEKFKHENMPYIAESI